MVIARYVFLASPSKPYSSILVFIQCLRVPLYIFLHNLTICSLNLRANSLLSAALPDTFDEASAPGDALSAPVVSKDVTVVVISSIVCLVVPLIVVAARVVQGAERFAARACLKFGMCVAAIGKRLKSSCVSDSGSISRQSSHASASAALLPSSSGS